MNDEDTKLQALAGQIVTVTIGGKPYSLRRATLGDVAAMRSYIKTPHEGETPLDPDMLALSYLVCNLMEPKQTITPEQLLYSIPVDDYESFMEAMNTVGFRKLQTMTKQAQSRTGA